MASFGHLTRNLPLEKNQTALLVVDMQKYMFEDGYWTDECKSENKPKEKSIYMFDRVKDTTVPSIQKLLAAFREKKGEIVYTFVEGLTKDCRDHSLDYKLSGILIPKGSPGAAMLDELAPLDDEILIPKTSCSVFQSTNIDYILRNLGMRQLVVVGMITNQCVESAVRDAADVGYYVTLVDDACAALSEEEHQRALANLKGFARICQAEQVVQELSSW